MIYIFLADGFEETEAICPIDIMRRAELEVIIVAAKSSLEVTGGHGIKVMADITAAELDFNVVPDMVILPGGMPGTSNLEKNSIVKEQVLRASREGAYVAAICAAPMILGKLGLLEGKQAVCYPGFEKYLAGATIVDKNVVTDGKTITGRGMGAALEFGLELVSALCGPEEANKIKKAVIATL